MEHRGGPSPNEFDLEFQGRLLNDNKKIQDSGIIKESILIVRKKGAGSASGGPASERTGLLGSQDEPKKGLCPCSRCCTIL